MGQVEQLGGQKVRGAPNGKRYPRDHLPTGPGGRRSEQEPGGKEGGEVDAGTVTVQRKTPLTAA
jgi:hypothetical protein